MRPAHFREVGRGIQGDSSLVRASTKAPESLHRALDATDGMESEQTPALRVARLLGSRFERGSVEAMNRSDVLRAFLANFEHVH